MDLKADYQNSTSSPASRLVTDKNPANGRDTLQGLG